MIVGFTVTSLATDEQREELFEYLSQITVVTDDVKNNIIKVGAGINVYAKNIDITELSKKSFGYDLINVEKGEAIVISLLSQRLELPIDTLSSISLEPTGYTYVSPEVIEKLAWAVEKGLILCISLDSTHSNWILRNGNWDDNGEWIDSEQWNDGV